MRTKDTRPARPLTAEPVVDTAHRIRRRMRDLRDPHTDIPHPNERMIVQEPKFLFFRRSLFPVQGREEMRDSNATWFVLGAWLLVFAVIGVALVAAVHFKGHV